MKKKKKNVVLNNRNFRKLFIIAYEFNAKRQTAPAIRPKRLVTFFTLKFTFFGKTRVFLILVYLLFNLIEWHVFFKLLDVCQNMWAIRKVYKEP